MKENFKYPDEFILLEGFKKNDLSAFRSIYDIFYPQVYNFANRILREPAESEDIISESFVIIWERRQNFNSLKSLASYLYAVVRNKCYAHLKDTVNSNLSKKKFSYLISQANQQEVTDAIRADLIQYSIIAAQKLPPEMKKVFQLIYIEGFSATEAAKILNLSVHTVNAQKSNAIKRVKHTLLKKGLLIFFF
jgi:RNA polymerase sigma factor (sigma-70 family)